MKITVICVGKLKENYFTQAVTEYSKRLSRYTKLEIIELPDEKTPDNTSAADELRIKSIEGEKILKQVKEGTYCLALAIEGKMHDSVDFSNQLEKLKLSGKSHLTFIIGGSLGLSDEVLKRADTLISFSKMTFPHQLMRVILLEQIYRAYRIAAGEPYHK
jgi:23S rRNA (pseudouridine1915-N3)-methyltransferase